LGLLALGAAALLAWGRGEGRSSSPLVDMSLMRLRGVWPANAAALLIGLGMYASFLIFPELVQAPARLGYGFGASVTGAGLFMLPTAAAQLLLGPVSAMLHRRVSLRAQLIAGQLGCAAGFASLALWHDAPWQVYAATTVLGVGFWLCLVALPNQVIAAVPADRTGSATAVNTVLRNAGGALGSQLAAAIIVSSARAGAPAASGYIGALVLCAAATCVGAFVACATPRKNPRSPREPRDPPRITTPALSHPLQSASRLQNVAVTLRIVAEGHNPWWPMGVGVLTAEEQRLQEARAGVPWRTWGPYLSERQWGTVREDYSDTGDAWSYFSHDEARSRAYRWGEDGIAGISDDKQRLCLALALWNERDPILKERLFGLTNAEGNHGEDVKEYYFYVDNLPTHSYQRYLYKYPQGEFPYNDLAAVNRERSRREFEYELLDTGIFNG